MFPLKSDLTLDREAHEPVRLMFSPDGRALLASVGNVVQVWPRWLDGPPRPAVTTTAALERVAFNAAGSLVYLYRSGNSYTDTLTVATGNVAASGLPKQDPSWAHFDSAGGFFLVCRGRGELVRYDPVPDRKTKVREAWVVTRHTAGTDRTRKTLGSHYRFGAICGSARVFVGLEYKFGGSEPFHGLTVRSVADGAAVFHRALKAADASELLQKAGLTLAVHPTGRYMAYPDGAAVRFRSLAEGAKVRAKVAIPAPPAKRKAPAKAAKAAKPKPVPACRAVAFDPAGAVLAAAGDSGLVTLFDTRTWKATRSFDWKVGKLRAVCFSADGTRAAVLGEKGDVVVWDVDV